MSGNKIQFVAIDTNIFIYQFSQNIFHKKTDKVFQQLIEQNITAITSVITLTELLSLKTSEEKILELQELFLETPHLKIIEVNQEIAMKAAAIRRRYNFRLPDSIQLATAICSKADVFLTNDKKLQKFKELKVKTI